MASTQNTTEGNYSFLTHSDSTLSSDSLSIGENPNLPKQKRRRTSPRDHAILEAAYLRNSKPDKHERVDIIRQVELGEKEVQIWFQNRRQNDRRKSKPLQPHELLAHFRNAAPLQPVQQAAKGEESKSQAVDATHAAGLDVTRPSSRSSSIHELLNPPLNQPASMHEENVNNPESTDPLPTPPSSFDHAKTLNKMVSTVTSTPPPVVESNTQSHSRKRSHEVMTKDTRPNPNVVLPNASTVLPKPKCLTRSSSFVRLAMTVDGAVKVRTNDEPTPSPPKQRTLPSVTLVRKRESLGRSQSAIENGFGFKDINPPIRKPGEAGFGRSRDARTWEFYCDRDSGDALSTQAEAERSGSAVGAINLIRSRSQRNKMQALSPNPTKQNTRRIRSDQSTTKPKLARAMSSMARLQNLDGASEDHNKSNKRASHNRSPSTDSDKENWAPGTRNSHHHMRRMHPSLPRVSILQESDVLTAAGAVQANVAQEQENRTLTGKEKAKGDDLDCIHGLLSLSQGAWQ